MSFTLVALTAATSHAAFNTFESAGAKLHGTEVPVLYATNRGAVIEKPEPLHTILPSERLRMGIAHVRIGDDSLDWDTLLLMGTSVVAHGVQAPGLARVQEAQSAAAYLVSRRYAATLLGCFADSIAQMEVLRSPGLRAYTTSRLAIDQVWKPLQRRDRWYIFSPAFGHQRPSFSDIEQREVNYDATTYGLAAGAPSE